MGNVLNGTIKSMRTNRTCVTANYADQVSVFNPTAYIVITAKETLT